MQSKRIVIQPVSLKKGCSTTLQLARIEAYAIDYFDFLINGVAGNYPCINIQGFNIVITATEYDLDVDDHLELLIHYHGIRDYEALFSFVADTSLRKRIAEFYHDSEKCFENGAWLPFSLMCGGIFEGILISQSISGNNFADKISNALSAGIIDSNTRLVMDNVRDNRNLVHANRHNQPYVARKEAMDIRTTLDKLIEKF